MRRTCFGTVRRRLKNAAAPNQLGFAPTVTSITCVLGGRPHRLRCRESAHPTGRDQLIRHPHYTTAVRLRTKVRPVRYWGETTPIMRLDRSVHRGLDRGESLPEWSVRPDFVGAPSVRVACAPWGSASMLQTGLSAGGHRHHPKFGANSTVEPKLHSSPPRLKTSLPHESLEWSTEESHETSRGRCSYPGSSLLTPGVEHAKSCTLPHNPHSLSGSPQQLHPTTASMTFQRVRNRVRNHRQSCRTLQTCNCHHHFCGPIRILKSCSQK